MFFQNVLLLLHLQILTLAGATACRWPITGWGHKSVMCWKTSEWPLKYWWKVVLSDLRLAWNMDLIRCFFHRHAACLCVCVFVGGGQRFDSEPQIDPTTRTCDEILLTSVVQDLICQLIHRISSKLQLFDRFLIGYDSIPYLLSILGWLYINKGAWSGTSFKSNGSQKNKGFVLGVMTMIHWRPLPYYVLIS